MGTWTTPWPGGSDRQNNEKNENQGMWRVQKTKKNAQQHNLQAPRNLDKHTYLTKRYT